MEELATRQTTLDFRGIHADFLADKTQEISLEGSLSSGKTTVAIWKEIDALLKYPGIWTLIARWTDDAVTTKMIPAFEELCDIREIKPVWNTKEKCFELDNGSRCFMFGLKAVSMIERYNKIRGLPVSRILIDQSEEIPQDIADELRARLRPDVKARIRGAHFPFQLTFVSNPVDTDHWIAKQFPVTDPHKSRKYYSLSLFDNAHNLPQEMIDGLLLAYPPDHPKNLTVIMGKRGPNVTGRAVYGGIYLKSLHHRPATFRAESELLEGFECGKHNPVWVTGQVMHAGGLALLGGIFGEGIALEDFFPMVKRYRAEWFPADVKVRSCSGPMGEKRAAQSGRFTILNIMHKHGIKPIWRDNANAPDVRLAMIESIMGYARRRNMKGDEELAVNDTPDRWLKLSSDGTVAPYPFMHFAFEGGYVWKEGFSSISHDTIREPMDDDKFASAMQCVENIELNFCSSQLTEAEREAKRLKLAQQSARGSLPGSGSWLGS